MNATSIYLTVMRGNLAEKYGENRSRRGFIREAAGIGVTAVGVPIVASKGVGAKHESPENGETHLYSQTSKYREPFTRDFYYDHHMASSIEHVEQDPGGSHEFRVAGDFCIVMKDGRLPPEHTGSVSIQIIRIENESPGGLSVFTSSNSNEIAMNPKPANYSGGSSQAFSIVTSALSVAAGLAGSTTGSLALGATSLLSGMYALLDDGSTSTTGLYEWREDTPTYNDRRGGHHANFGVNEHGGGSIVVTSGIKYARNKWRLSFDNGLTDVVQI